MATLDSSPSHFAGQPWSEWANTVPSPPYSDSGGESSESKATDDSDSMKLNVEDSALFGVCPSQDEFFLVQCEKCNKVLKPQALNIHLRNRHCESSAMPGLTKAKTLQPNCSLKASPAKSGSVKKGLSVPTKASMKEIPPSISNARKLGAELNARLKGPEKSKRNHTMPVVKVERMNVNKMDVKKVTPSQVAKAVSPLTNGNSVSEQKMRKTPTPPPLKAELSAKVKTENLNPPLLTAITTVTTKTKTVPPNFKSTFTSRPISPPKSTTHVLFLTNTTPSVSIATPTLTTATTTCVTTTMTTTHMAPQVSATINFSNMSFAKPCKTDLDIKNLQNLEADDDDHDYERELVKDLDLNPVKIEDRSSDEGYSSSLYSVSDTCLKNDFQRAALLKGQTLSSLSDTKLHSISTANVGNRTKMPVENSSLKSHLLSDRKPINMNSRSVTSLNSFSNTSLNSYSSTSLNSYSGHSLNSSATSSNTSIGSTSGSSKKKYPRSTIKSDKCIPCKDREYDPNKHCGVNGEDSKPCTRSLTCKTHAISKRRQVAGRRKPFDDLLKEHRAAKELLLKQKEEMKQAAALGLPVPTALQAGTPTVPDLPIKHNQMKVEKENTSGHMDSHIAIFKPVKPNSLHSHRSSLSSLHSFSTPSPRDDLKPPDFPDRVEEDDAQESMYLPYHPRPAAMCTFGARSHSNNGGKRCYSFSRRTDMFRVAFLSALEKHLNPPPSKKRCVESNLPKDTQGSMNAKDPYDFQTTLPVDASGFPQVQHFNTVLNTTDNSSAKHKSRSSSGSKHNKQKDNSGSRSPGHATNSAIINAIGNSAKRKRSSSGILTSAASLPNSVQTVSSNSTMHTVSAPTFMGNITINSQTNTPLIAIPNVNLSSTTLSHLNNSKQPKNNQLFKDIGLVLTGLDGSIVNGQYLNLTAAPQTIDDKMLQQHNIVNKNKIMNLEQFKNLQKSNLIPVTQFFVDGGGVPGSTVLAPVTFAPMSNSSVVSIASNVSQPQTTPMLASHTLKPGAVSSHVTLTSVPNGVLSSTDKSNPRPQGVVHHKPKSIHPQHGILTNAVIASSNSQQVCGGQIFTTQLALKPLNIAKSGATGELSMQPVSLTFPLTGLRVPGQQHSTQTFYITSTNDSQQHDNIQQHQVSNSPSLS
ncbi:serine-rich adhesin for platelets-like [Mytilus edulis]|uniref:serine-rich adhesin for platelets-like n=1 Tax=Mytilus edulis TaxID=6550 RepID=UPI0039EE927B